MYVMISFPGNFLVEKLADKNIVTKVASVNEWLYYIDYVLQNKLLVPEPSFIERMKNKLESAYKRKVERDIKKIMSRSGLCEYHFNGCF